MGEAARALDVPKNPSAEPEASAAELSAQVRIKSRREKSLKGFVEGFMVALCKHFSAKKEVKRCGYPARLADGHHRLEPEPDAYHDHYAICMVLAL
jgi:hypothetical protein